MRVGIDFDNTIACYDGVFHAAGVERALIPADLASDKSSVRNYLRQAQREDQWTELQGYIYGARMDLASPYEGVVEAIRRLLNSGHTVFVISHKTRTPYAGPAYDLHEAARGFLAAHGIEGSQDALLPDDRVFFELTLPAKLARISACACDIFIDDLPELFSEEAFPRTTTPLLFDPADLYASETRLRRFAHWRNLDTIIETLERPS